MKLAVITVPYITQPEHFNLTKYTYQSFSLDPIYKDALKIAVINKCVFGKEFIDSSNDHIIENDRNILARAWNLGIDYAIRNDCTHFYIPNLDIITTDKTISNLVALALRSPESCIYSSSAVESRLHLYAKEPQDISVPIKNHDQSFSSFLLSKEGFEKIGRFYEGFKPCYYEDNDYLYRSRLKNIIGLRTKNSLFYHFIQASVRVEGEEFWNNKYLKFLESNKEKYISRWGGIPGEETYLTPYNK